MNVTFKFEIGEKVTSIKLNYNGIVESASYGKGGKEYYVLTFTGKEFISRWLNEDLLEKA